MPVPQPWSYPRTANRHLTVPSTVRWAPEAFLLVTIALLVLAALCPATSADGPLYSSPTDRFGVDVRREFGTIADYDVASLHIAWYSDWGASLHPLRPGSIEYAQLIWVAEGNIQHPETGETLQELDPLGPFVDANPGSLWMIGNEPECIHQGNSTPEQYAEAYHRLYTFIKGRDPSAQVAIGGVVEPTPLRLKWLDRVLGHYLSTFGQRMPVDVWNIHNMILPEVRGGWGCEIPRGLSENQGALYGVEDNDSMDYFVQHVRDFRTWMRDRGQRDKPLIISEYGVLMPIELGLSAERVNVFMDATFDYFLTARDDVTGYPADENRLVQRWLWWSLNNQPWNPDTGAGSNGALFDHRHLDYPGILTVYGENFKAYTESLVGCTLRGTVVLQRPSRPAPDPSWSVRLTIAVGAAQYDVMTDASGHFTLANLAPGTWDIVVKGEHTLSNLRRRCALSDGLNLIDMGELREGDANGDDRVNSSDFLLLRASYFKRGDQPGFVAGADFNQDGVVNSSDFLLLRSSYFLHGPLELSED